MHNIIYRCSSFIYKHSNRVLTCRTLHASAVKCLRRRLLGSTNSLWEPTTLHQFTPVRLLYYLEHENVKEYKRHPSSLELTEETIKDVCLSENPSSPEDWDSVKVEIMSRCFNLTDETFDSILMQVLLTLGNLQLAQSFMNYLKERKLKPNFVTLGKYLVLCSKNVDIVGQDVILETYEKLLSELNTSFLNTKVVEFLVQGLCATDKWRISLDYTDKLPKYQLSVPISDSLACAALRNGDYKLAWGILNKWYKCGTTPGVAVFEEYMKFITRVRQKHPIKADHYFTNMAGYVRRKNIILKQKVIFSIEEYFRRSDDYSAMYSKINRDGVCSACKNKLETCSLTEEEFSYLRDSFLEYSVKKSDIFINTTHSEFVKYCRFIEKYKPFDIVLDGLNVAHTVGEKKGNNLATQLFNVVDHLSRSWNRILVLGRNHMKEWSSPIMTAVRQRCIIFFVSNMSQDDPFLIYAALASGPNTNLMSLDMMRDHISRLPDPRLIQLFKKWQQSHQVYLAIGEKKHEFVLMGPLKHTIAIQGSMQSGCWHVPFDDDMKREPYEELNNWLCIQKRNQ